MESDSGQLIINLDEQIQQLEACKDYLCNKLHEIEQSLQRVDVLQQKHVLAIADNQENEEVRPKLSKEVYPSSLVIIKNRLSSFVEGFRPHPKNGSKEGLGFEIQNDYDQKSKLPWFSLCLDEPRGPTALDRGYFPGLVHLKFNPGGRAICHRPIRNNDQMENCGDSQERINRADLKRAVKRKMCGGNSADGNACEKAEDFYVDVAPTKICERTKACDPRGLTAKERGFFRGLAQPHPGRTINLKKYKAYLERDPRGPPKRHKGSLGPITCQDDSDKVDDEPDSSSLEDDCCEECPCTIKENDSRRKSEGSSRSGAISQNAALALNFVMDKISRMPLSSSKFVSQSPTTTVVKSQSHIMHTQQPPQAMHSQQSHAMHSQQSHAMHSQQSHAMHSHQSHAIHSPQSHTSHSQQSHGIYSPQSHSIYSPQSHVVRAQSPASDHPECSISDFIRNLTMENDFEEVVSICLQMLVANAVGESASDVTTSDVATRTSNSRSCNSGSTESRTLSLDDSNVNNPNMERREEPVQVKYDGEESSGSEEDSAISDLPKDNDCNRPIQINYNFIEVPEFKNKRVELSEKLNHTSFPLLDKKTDQTFSNPPLTTNIGPQNDSFLNQIRIMIQQVVKEELQNFCLSRGKMITSTDEASPNSSNEKVVSSLKDEEKPPPQSASSETTTSTETTSTETESSPEQKPPEIESNASINIEEDNKKIEVMNGVTEMKNRGTTTNVRPQSHIPSPSPKTTTSGFDARLLKPFTVPVISNCINASTKRTLSPRKGVPPQKRSTTPNRKPLCPVVHPIAQARPIRCPSPKRTLDNNNRNQNQVIRRTVPSHIYYKPSDRLFMARLEEVADEKLFNKVPETPSELWTSTH